MSKQSSHLLDEYGTPMKSAEGGYQGMLYVGSYPMKDGKPLRNQPRRLMAMPNTVLFGGADIMARVVSGDEEFKISAMYFEFENLASPGDAIVAPAFDRSGGLTYYQSLASPKDYLRVPIDIGVSILSSDVTKYQGNQTTFFALTGGTEGVLGRPFNAASNSTVYGVALAATPVLADPTQDIVFSRAYFPDLGGGENKFLKELGFEIGTDWAIRFV